jgi:hypothetical protein
MRCSDKDSAPESAAVHNEVRYLRAVASVETPPTRQLSPQIVRGARHSDLSRSVVIITTTQSNYDFLVVTKNPHFI